MNVKKRKKVKRRSIYVKEYEIKAVTLMMNITSGREREREKMRRKREREN